jgi:hypothetical protein
MRFAEGDTPFLSQKALDWRRCGLTKVADFTTNVDAENQGFD